MKKFNTKSLGITMGLFLVLMVVVIIEISIFISGPARKYEDKIDVQEANIKETYKEIKDLQRHVFNYVVYIGEDEANYVWFNEEGKAITSRKKNTYKETGITSKALKEYSANDVKVRLGYGYNNPVYVVSCDKGTIIFDYDTHKEVYFLAKGMES